MTNPKSARQQWEEEMVQSGIGIIDELGNFAITRQKNPECRRLNTVMLV